MKKGEKYILLASIGIITIAGVVLLGPLFTTETTMNGSTQISKAQYMENSGTIRSLELQIDTLRSEHAQEIRSLKSQTPNTIIQDNSSELYELQDKLDDVNRENRSLEKEVSQLASMKSPVNGDVLSLKETIKQLQSQLDNEKSKKIVRDDSETVSRLKFDLSKALQENTDLINEIKVLEDTIEKLEEQK